MNTKTTGGHVKTLLTHSHVSVPCTPNHHARSEPGSPIEQDTPSDDRMRSSCLANEMDAGRVAKSPQTQPQGHYRGPEPSQMSDLIAARGYQHSSLTHCSDQMICSNTRPPTPPHARQINRCNSEVSLSCYPSKRSSQPFAKADAYGQGGICYPSYAVQQIQRPASCSYLDAFGRVHEMDMRPPTAPVMPTMRVANDRIVYEQINNLGAYCNSFCGPAGISQAHIDRADAREPFDSVANTQSVYPMQNTGNSGRYCNYSYRDYQPCDQPKKAEPAYPLEHSAFCARKRKCGIPWTPSEDAALLRAVQEFGCKDWKRVAQFVMDSTRTGAVRSSDQCSQHWVRVLNPDIIKGRWTTDEDKLLISAVRQCPPKQWKLVAERLPGRTDIQVRYRLKRLSVYLVQQNILSQEFLP